MSDQTLQTKYRWVICGLLFFGRGLERRPRAQNRDVPLRALRAAHRGGDWPAVLLIGLADAAHQAWSANLYTAVSDMFPKTVVAKLIGVGGMVFPVVTGALLDHLANGYAIVFGFCSAAYLAAFGINHLLAPRFEPVEAGVTQPVVPSPAA